MRSTDAEPSRATPRTAEGETITLGEIPGLESLPCLRTVIAVLAASPGVVRIASVDPGLGEITLEGRPSRAKLAEALRAAALYVEDLRSAGLGGDLPGCCGIRVTPAPAKPPRLLSGWA